MARDGEERVHSISSLPRSRAEDQHERMRSYTISMAVRTVCFLLAGVFVTVVDWPPGAWICIVAALLLPYPAVLIANNRDMRTHVEEHDPVVHRMVTAASGSHDRDSHEDATDAPDPEPAPTVIRGTAMPADISPGDSPHAETPV
ncbi:DUF3099 domain-containing protein [Mobilicoccus pelagius]|uniref:DUF3099 domain-containing protein n=1 Tax=Mobilicoccus pelagius NBRC 104925 TaxID=1089455 RepID=H5UTK0_9MICO|nr:DUF3099 domain-containing protein [Mobilicoccus pelagius]GAB49058.1 hypothetical protein MOPEL_096_00650 [Mobilicoccus pelagius NBRC 104925]